jgi:hypothetical protein
MPGVTEAARLKNHEYKKGDGFYCILNHEKFFD